MSDPLLDLIAQLPEATVAPEHARRTQVRCHRALTRHESRPTVERPARRRAWSRALIGLGALYLVEAVRQALWVYGLR